MLLGGAKPAGKLQAKRKQDMEKMIQMQYNTEDKHSNMSSCSNKVGIEMVEVEVNPTKVTVSDSPLVRRFGYSLV